MASKGMYYFICKKVFIHFILKINWLFGIKVTNFTKSNGEENGSFVNVTWFGSSTTSYLNCDQINPFLDFYKVCSDFKYIFNEQSIPFKFWYFSISKHFYYFNSFLFCCK